MRIAPAVILLALTVACGDSTSGPIDAGDATDGGMGGDDFLLPSGAMLAAPAPPVPPAPVAMDACPDGWRLQTSDVTGGADACEPWPEAGRVDCAAGEAHFPGTPGCAPVGAPCPVGAFPEGLPATGPVLYVQSGAAAGDGTIGAPFGTIGQAVAAATPGTTLAVATGTYDEHVALGAGLALWGACADQTLLRHDVRDGAPSTLVVGGTDVVVRNVRISGARAGLLVDGRARAQIEGVIVDRATETGLRVHRTGNATVDQLIIRDTQTEPSDGLSAFGLVVEFGGVATVSRASIERNRVGAVIVANSDSDLTLTDSVIRDTLGQESSGMFGSAVQTQPNAAATFRRVAVEDNRYIALFVTPASELALEDTVVRGTMTQPDDTSGDGAAVDDGGTLRATRTLFDRNVQTGVFARGATIALVDTILRETEDPVRPLLAGGAIGVHAIAMSDLTLERVSVERNGFAGIVAENATASIRDATVLETRSGPDGDGGFGFVFQQTADIDVERALLRGNRSIAALVSDPAATVRLADLTGTGTLTREVDDDLGSCIHAQLGASLELERILCDENVSTSLSAIQDATVVATDVTLRNTRGAIAGQFQTIGVGILLNASDLVLERAAIESARGWALMASPDETLTRASTVTATDLRVSDGLPFEGEPALLESVAASLGTLGGRGIDVQRGSTGTFTRLLIEGTYESALNAWNDVELDVTDAVIRDTRSDQSTGRFGIGIEAVSGTRATVQQIRIENSREIAMRARGAGVVLDASDIEILDTAANECSADDRCPGEPGGIGVGAYEGGRVQMRRFRVSSCVLAGVQVAATGEIDLSDGEVSQCVIGANVQNPDFDVTRLTTDVRYVDNDLNLDATVLPVPMATATVDAPTE